MEYENWRGRDNLQEKALQDNNVEVRLYDIIRCLITLLAVVASSPMLVTSLINPIDQTLEQQQQKQQKPIPTEDDFKIHQRQKDDIDG
jgi:hypothetical protein